MRLLLPLILAVVIAASGWSLYGWERTRSTENPDHQECANAIQYGQLLTSVGITDEGTATVLASVWAKCGFDWALFDDLRSHRPP